MSQLATKPHEAVYRRVHEPETGNVPWSSTRRIVAMSVVVGVLAFISAGLGLLWQGAADSTSVTTVRGQEVQLYGDGIYRFDSMFIAANNRSSDIVTLALGLPLLVVSIALVSRGSMRGSLLLLGTHGYLLYVAAGYALGAVAYNQLFLLYVAWFSATLYAFITTIGSLTGPQAARAFSGQTTRRWPAGFMIASGVLTLGVWVQEPLAGLLSGKQPSRLESYSTLFTHAFDMAIIVPAAIIAGALILKRKPLGYVVASSLLILEAMLMPLVIIATFVQMKLGISFTPGEVIGPISGFTVFGALAVLTLVLILRRVPRVPRELATERIK